MSSWGWDWGKVGSCDEAILGWDWGRLWDEAWADWVSYIGMGLEKALG